jgi:MFS family permease
MSASTIAPVLPLLAEAFSDTPDAAFLSKLVLTMPALAITLWAPLAGAIIDRFGRTRFLRINLVLYAFAGASAFVLTDLHQILAGRALLGLAVGAEMTCVQALAGDYFSGAARTRYVSLQSMCMSGGGVLFVALGGMLADISWRAPFLVYLLALGALALTWVWIDEPPRQAPVAVPAGAELPARGTIALPWGRIALVYLLQFFGMAMYYLVSAQVPFLLREIGAERSLYAGLAIAAGSGASILSTMRYASLLRSTSHLTVYASGFGIMSVGFLLMGVSGAVAGVIAGAAIVGLGMGLVFPNGTIWMLSLADPRTRGRLAGGLTAAIFLGQFASPIVAEPFASSVGLGRLYEGAAAVLLLMMILLWGGGLLAARRARASADMQA